MFIVIDGIDGSGKGEMINRLHNYLFSRNKKNRILTTREPTYGRYGRQIREILKKEKDPMKNAELLLDLYVKDRKKHVENVIKPFLKGENSIVLCDRYYYSTIAFQHTQGIDLRLILERNREFPKPDFCFILDLDPKIALERISKTRQKEKFEDLKFMEKLRKNFLELKNILDDNIIVIDASKSKEEVSEEIKALLE